MKFTRRGFIIGAGSSFFGSFILNACSALKEYVAEEEGYIGPGQKYKPNIWAIFVRRKEPYGLLWPGAVYDGEKAKENYTEMLKEASREIDFHIKIFNKPIYSYEEAKAWIEDAKKAKPDGLFVLLLDRQRHSWPTARLSASSGIPTIVYSPLGTSFTFNTAPLTEMKGCVVYSTDDFSQARFGLKMLCSKARLKNSKCVVIRGNTYKEAVYPDLGINLKYIPGKVFISEYNNTKNNKEIDKISDWYIKNARIFRGPTKEDVINGIRAYFASIKILKKENADGITMDCLHILAKRSVSLPCLAWSRLNDNRIPAICEADIGAVGSQFVVQYLFERPGFQQDPVAETKDKAVIGAHCSCPTRLRGFGKAPLTFDLIHHHALRDATARPIWDIGQNITMLDVFPVNPKRNKNTLFLISKGKVIKNKKVPPSGGCVVSIEVKFDTKTDVRKFPGFHQVFFYGDFADELRDFAKLLGIDYKYA